MCNGNTVAFIIYFFKAIEYSFEFLKVGAATIQRPRRIMNYEVELKGNLIELNITLKGEK